MIQTSLLFKYKLLVSNPYHHWVNPSLAFMHRLGYIEAHQKSVQCV